MRNVLVALLVVPLTAAIAIGACAVAGRAWESEHSLSIEGVRQVVERDLPAGSTRAQVIEFVESRDLDYTAGLATNSDPRLAYTTPFVRAVFRDTCPEAVAEDMFERRCDITVTFELSTRDELQRVFIDD